MTGDTFDKFQPPDRGRFGDDELAPTPAARGPRVTGASDLNDDRRNHAPMVKVTLPEWLAREKGLL